MAVAGDTTYLAGSLLEIIADAEVALSEAGVTRRLVRNIYRPNADTISIPVYNAGTHTLTSADVAAVTDGTEISASYLGSSKATITLAMEAIRSDVYDDTTLSSADNPDMRVGTILGNSMAANMDKDLNALFDGFSNSVGTSTVAISVDDFYAGLAYLNANPKAPAPLNAVLYTNQIWGDYGIMNDLVTSTQFGGSPDLQSQGLRDGFVDTLAGIRIFHSPEFTEASNAVKAGIFSGQALAFGWSGPEGIIRIEPERHATYTRTAYVASAFYGVKEVVDGYGVELWTKTS